MDDSNPPHVDLPKTAHSSIICGATGCGKTVFALDLLETYYRSVFDHIVFLCPTLRWNRTFRDRPWILSDPEIYLFDPGDRLHDVLRGFYECFAGKPTLYLIDDCSAKSASVRKRDTLSDLAFSGRHASQSVWVLTQKYNSVLRDFREQVKWVSLFCTKDRDSFDDCLRENDVIPTSEERAAAKRQLSESRHRKLLLKTDQPTAYQVL